MLRIAIFIVLILIRVHQVRGIIGYDCGAPQLNITTVSLLNVGDCNIPINKPDVKSTYIQLLQLSQYEKTRVIQCKIIIRRTVYHCGMASHVSVVHNGEAEYLAEITHDQCINLHATGRLNLGLTTLLDGFKVNQTSSRSLTLAGFLNTDGDCDGVQYSDPYGTWKDAVVQGIITVTLQDYYAAVNLEADIIRLRTGLTCTHTDTTCIDIEGGHTFWYVLPWDYCSFRSYDVLYEGYADRMMDKTNDDTQIVYSLTARDTIFALTRKNEEKVCGETLIKTEHPKLLIIETSKADAFVKRKPIATENLDIFTYVNSKFVYVERHIRTQMASLYRDVLKQKCELEQQIIKNALAIATYSPDEFAYHFMKGPGYMAAVAGEVIHIIKCVATELQVRHTEECYQQLPVKMGDKKLFLTPKTHIINKSGVQLDCNSFIPSMYLLENNWYKLTPKPVESLAPITIQPMTRPTWKYINPGTLATNGIYSEADLKNLQDRIIFPMEKPAILNAVVRTITGQSVATQGITLSNLLDEDTLDKLAESTWTRLWGSFMYFGTASAGCIGIYLTVRVVKMVVDILVHGYALHTIYGWSLHLLGALWDSVTNLLLHMSHRSSRRKQISDQDQAEQGDKPLISPPIAPTTPSSPAPPETPSAPAVPSQSTLLDGDKILSNYLSKSLYPSTSLN